jgi:hypothetical protein
MPVPATGRMLPTGKDEVAGGLRVGTIALPSSRSKGYLRTLDWNSRER